MTGGETLPRIIHHTCLQARGGALQVAKTLSETLTARGLDSSMSFEVRELDTGPEPIPASEVGALAGSDAILHLHSTLDWNALLAGVLPASEGGPRLVLTPHDCSPIMGGCSHPLSCQKWLDGCPPPCPLGFSDTDKVCRTRRELLKSRNPIIAAPSRWLMKMIRAALPGLSTRVVPNGVPWPDPPYPRARARAELGLADKARAVLFVAHGGVKAAYKSGPMWLEYWKAIKQAEPRAVCFMVGGDEARREGDLFFWPYVPSEKLHPLMRAMDVLAYPTLADNHPLTVLEAMASGLPVVSFAEGGVVEQVVNGATGLLVDPGDHEGFIRALLDLLADPARSRSMGRQAMDHGASRFTVRRMTDGYVALYSSLPG